MSKLTRKTQLLFGSRAGSSQIGQFGSFAAGSPSYTKDPSTIQALSNYLEGWFGAILGNNSPCIEDMNALCYLFAYQLSYLFQEGIPEWDSGTTYYQYSVIQSGGVFYMSTADNNLNNAVSTSYWGAMTVPGIQTLNAVQSNQSVRANSTMFWPNLIIGTGITFSVPSMASLLSANNITISGSGALVVLGSARIL
jgi:hypothetical protein